MQFSLNLALTDVEACGIGLAGAWSTVPDWLRAALATSCARDFDALLTASKQNAQVGLLAHALAECGLSERIEPAAHARMTAYNWESRLIEAAQWSALAEIDYVLGALEFRPVYLKGPVTSRHYYAPSWHRGFKDIDVLVDQARALEAYRVLHRLDYRQGRFDRARRQVQYRDDPVTLDDPRGYELPRLVKMLPVRLDALWRERLQPVLADSTRLVVEDDIASIPAQVEVHYALEPDRRIPFTLCAAGIVELPHGRCLDPESQLVYLCYKAYVDIALLGARGGIKLVADVVRLIDKDGDRITWPGLLARYHARGLCAPIAYVLAHARAIYGCCIGTDIGAGQAGECACTAPHGEIGDVVAGSALDLGDFLPALATGRRAMQLQYGA